MGFALCSLLEPAEHGRVMQRNVTLVAGFATDAALLVIQGFIHGWRNRSDPRQMSRRTARVDGG
jgi:hypothetical protein